MGKLLHPLAGFSAQRVLSIVLAGMALGVVYLFQQTDFLRVLCQCEQSGNTHFAFNKFFRLIANDLCMLIIIHYWFVDRKITRLAFWIQAIDTLILLPIYLFLKLTMEGDSEISNPLLSQFHRLIVNPTLMILIFPAVYYQRLYKQNENE